MKTDRPWWIVILICGAILSSGCGPKGRGLPKAKVTGTVTYPGKSLPNGKIIFQHTSGEMDAIPFGADGKYELDVTVGKNKVMVQSQTSSKEEAGPDSGRAMEVFTYHVPERYLSFDGSGLELDVPDSGTIYDVEIED